MNEHHVLSWMRDFLRFKRAVVFVKIVQKVERRLDRLSTRRLPWQEGVVFHFFFSCARRFFQPQTHPCQGALGVSSRRSSERSQRP